VKEEKMPTLIKRVMIIAAALSVLFIVYIGVNTINIHIRMRNIAAEHLQNKYGLDTKKMKMIDYRGYRESSFMGSGWIDYSWVLVELSDGTRVRVMERPILEDGWKTIGFVYTDDYQLLDECLLGAEYFSGVLGLDIGFAEYYRSHISGRDSELQDAISDIYYQPYFTDNEKLNGYMTKENINEYLDRYLALPNRGIVMYIRVDFEKDDVDSMFAETYNKFLASPLADTNAEIILCAHDVDLDIRFVGFPHSPNALGNYYAARKDVDYKENSRFPIRGVFSYMTLTHYKPYALRLYGTDKVGDMSKLGRHYWSNQSN
jgi:hypothetical protein